MTPQEALIEDAARRLDGNSKEVWLMRDTFNAARYDAIPTMSGGMPYPQPSDTLLTRAAVGDVLHMGAEGAWLVVSIDAEGRHLLRRQM